MRSSVYALAAVGIGALCLGTGPSAHASDGVCATSQGVTVIVDASALGAGVILRCAGGEPQSGFDALTMAGLTWTSVSRSPSMLCRIEALPAPNVEACVLEPPGNAYWMYFRAQRGGQWQYSQVGAHTKPQPGSVEGWLFYTGQAKQPTVAVPPAIPTEQPTPATDQVTPTALPSPVREPSTVPSRPSKHADQQSSNAHVAPNAAHVVTKRARETGAPIQSDNATDAQVATAVAPKTEVPDSGSALSTVVGLGTALALALVAGVLEVRRRRGQRLIR